MQKQLLSVKQAAEMLQLDERSVRDRLVTGQLKGKKKMVGWREKWFVYNSSVEDSLSKANERTMNEEGDFSRRVQTTTLDPQVQILAARVQELEEALKKTGIEDAVQTAVEVESTTIVEAVAEHDTFLTATHVEDSAKSAIADHPRSNVSAMAEALWNSLICKYQEKLEKKDQEISEIRAELIEKDRQLKLLPDFEKQKADLLKQIEAERQAAEIQFAKTAEKEVEAQKLTAEIDRLRLAAEEAKKKAEQAAINAEMLQVLAKQMDELKRPLWKKWFLPKEVQ